MKIGAVIVTYNRKELLLKTIEKLNEQTRKLDSIFIIDNCSPDQTYEYLIDNKILNHVQNPYFEHDVYIQKDGNIIYVRLPENSGGAGGFHEGVKFAVNDNCDWIWLMDDDIYPDQNALNEFEKFINSSEEEICALMGTRYFNNVPFSFESVVHNFSLCSLTEFKEKTVTETELLSNLPVRILDYPFEGPLLNASKIKEIGLPNKEFFIIGDDTDYALRLNKLGKSYILPQVKLFRMINPFPEVENGFNFDWKKYYTIRNTIYINKIYGKNFSVKYIRTFLIFIRTLLAQVKRIIVRRKFNEIFKLIIIIKAYVKGMNEKLGKDYIPGDF